jgi:hypothetical protein
LQVWRFPPDVTQLRDSPGDFLALAAVGLVTSFTSTLMFTALGSFFNKVSDPDMVSSQGWNTPLLLEQVADGCWRGAAGSVL